MSAQKRETRRKPTMFKKGSGLLGAIDNLKDILEEASGYKSRENSISSEIEIPLIEKPQESLLSIIEKIRWHRRELRKLLGQKKAFTKVSA